MNAYVRFIGVIDTTNVIHHVTFERGVNVITGKSSTGKSAMIEIFDYCLGSSDFTVPQGVITQSAQVFFVVLGLKSSALVLARKPGTTKCFVKEVTEPDSLDAVERYDASFFAEQMFIPRDDFKKDLGRYFDITMTDVDEDAEVRKVRGIRKSSTPSIRSFTSFMLQHQNLIANKHAVFYRFDQKEKRDQVIEHFRIFLGYANQEYFTISQQISSLRVELRKIDQQLPAAEEAKKRLIERIKLTLNEYAALSGTLLVSVTAETVAENPARWLQTVTDTKVQIDATSERFTESYNELDASRSRIVAELRTLERQRAAIRSSITYAKEYFSEASNVRTIKQATIRVSECPFCHSETSNGEDDANELLKAMEWLNTELRRSPYMRESFEANELRLNERIQELQGRLGEVQAQLNRLESQIAELQQQRPMMELAMRAKLRVEAILEESIESQKNDLQTKRASIETNIKRLEGQLSRFGVQQKLDVAAGQLTATMKEIGSRFAFEESYQPINLRFSFDTFDLWHEKEDGQQVFLRAMGSGANWLYSHLTLFLSLHRLFCSLGDTCKIPPILFLDQPSQVYFPSVIADNAETFDAKSLSTKAGRVGYDDDIREVENLYSQLIRFCRETETATGLMPQIIVTDHADNLKLENNASFEALVRARWRKRGFIDPVPPKITPTQEESDKPKTSGGGQA